MGAHHYLAFRGLVGRSVRHVAVLGEHWLALIGWHAGAFKLQARDRWIGCGTWPASAARCSGVRPLRPVALTSAPAAASAKQRARLVAQRFHAVG